MRKKENKRRWRWWKKKGVVGGEERIEKEGNIKVDCFLNYNRGRAQSNSYHETLS